MLRFAPSPNGPLHLGHAYSALLNDRIARALGGVWLLRIEDIDPARSREETVVSICRDLAWLGLEWPQPVRRQSGHLAAYAAAAAQLREAGLLYPCFCTRAAVVAAALECAGGDEPPRDPDGSVLYPGTCRHLDPSLAASRIAAGEPHAWRLDIEAALSRLGPVAWRRFAPGETGVEVVAGAPQRWGDVVVVRRDIPTSYHLSVVVDDAAQAVTHVVRGRDLEAATDIHATLAAALGLPSPCYHHHALVTDPEGEKLAKSRGSRSLADLRRSGASAADIRRLVGLPE